MITSLLEKLSRKSQIKALKNHSKVSLGSIKLGINDHFNISSEAKKVTLGSKLNFRNYIHILVDKKATLEIQNQVFMNNFCSVNCLEHIFIGENTLFGENVKLYDHNHVYTNEAPFLVQHQDFTTAPIHIGKNCWLGSNVVVLKGVTIGDNSIIGAGCVVYKDIPANSLVVNRQELHIKPR